MFKKEMRDIIDKLHKWDVAYEAGTPLVEDKVYDSLYYTLKELEVTSGFVFKDSPTQSIYFQKVDKLEKVKHEVPMLSLDKSKNIDDVENFIDDKHYLCMAKCDGLTIAATYENGKFVRAETRGNGEVGEDVTHNGFVMFGFPKFIDHKGKLIVHGEAIIYGDTFDSSIKDKYNFANPRNAVAGSIRLLDSEEASRRFISFIAWDAPVGLEDCKWLHERLEKLNDFGFAVVPYVTDDEYTKEDGLTHYSARELADIILNESKDKFIPIDGTVFAIDNLKEAADRGEATQHHLKWKYALKEYDEVVETELINIEYDVSRQGILTPVAVFKPIQFEDAEVSRASLHNLSIMWDKLGNAPYEGQKIRISKRNMIIPYVEDADKRDSGLFIGTPRPFVATICPICGGETEIRQDKESAILYCTNPLCDGKLVNRLDHFCSKKCLDIKGLSLATLNKLIDWGWIGNLREIFSLENFKSEWVKKPGFGAASVDKVLSAIEEGKNAPLDRFICACMIAEIGTKASKDLAKKYKTWNNFRKATKEELLGIDGFGPVMVDNILSFDYAEMDEIAKLMNNINLADTSIVNVAAEEFNEYIIKEIEKALPFIGQTFVITGKCSKPRSAIQADIEGAGGRVVGSVSSKTNYLVIDDINSTTGKAAKARQLNIPMISEEQLYQMMGE